VACLELPAANEHKEKALTGAITAVDSIKRDFNIVESRQLDLPAVPSVFVFRPRQG
jgi:hypothetical protein